MESQHYKRELNFHGRRILLEASGPAAPALAGHWLTAEWQPLTQGAYHAELTVCPISGEWNAVPAGTSWASGTKCRAGFDETVSPCRGFLYYDPAAAGEEDFILSVFAPFLSHVLRKLRLFELHAGAVVLNGQGVLIPAASGSGKTTTVFSLVREGFRYLADDHLYLEPEGESAVILGYSKPPAFLADSLERFPEFHHLKNTPDILRGGRRKKVLSVSELETRCGPRCEKAPLRMILFPQIDVTRPVSMEALDHSQTMMMLMRQTPWDHGGDVVCPANTAAQLALFRGMAQSVPAYRLFLNPDLPEIARVVRDALAEPKTSYACL